MFTKVDLDFGNHMQKLRAPFDYWPISYKDQLRSRVSQDMGYSADTGYSATSGFLVNCFNRDNYNSLL